MIPKRGHLFATGLPELIPGSSASLMGGIATLHKIPNEDILEGSWVERGYAGMWRIRLGRAAPISGAT
jgi:hypothetical protein